MTREELTDNEREFLEKYNQLDGIDRLRVRERIDEMLEHQHRENKQKYSIVKGATK